MSFKEHMQFLAMMIPTLLLLAIAAMTLAFPDRDPAASVPAGTFHAETLVYPPAGQEEVAVEHPEDRPPHTLAVR